MTVEEMKAKLIGSSDENRAAVFDEVLGEFSDVSFQLDEANRKLQEMTTKVNEVTESNLKLLDKVKYMGSDEEDEDGDEDDKEEYNVEDLFEIVN